VFALGERGNSYASLMALKMIVTCYRRANSVGPSAAYAIRRKQKLSLKTERKEEK